MSASSILRALIRRPALWPEAVRAYGALTPSRWWKAPPFLPVPRRVYLDWRLQTAYGSSGVAADPTDVIHFLEWRRAQR